ncbi:MAG: ParA family protein [Armatimonadota bacterium]
MARVIAIVNQKGGVGKTTTAINLAAVAAELGFSTLLVDIDPQGNATSGLGIDRSSLDRCIYDVLVPSQASGKGVPARDVLVSSPIPGLDVLPATINLAGADMSLATEIARERRLRDALSDLRKDYDIIFIDTGPSLGILTVNSLTAAESVIIPIQCEYYALEGLSQLLRVVELVRNGLNRSLRIRGVVLTMYDGRTRLSRQVASEVRRHFGDRVYKTTIPRNVRLAEAPSHGLPVTRYDRSSRGSRAYVNLCREVLEGA